jgi:formylglycine-generating enzyme required for sulfatase activity/serine/threonine protein kinase
MGTPLYMSPEQWKAEPITPAVDQYALGVMVYALITGRPPFEATTPYALMHKHLHEPPTPPQTIRPEVPEEVTDVLARALAKTPGDRFATVTAFALAFEKAISGRAGTETGFFTAPVHRRPVTPFPVTPSSPPPPTGTAPQPVYKSPIVWAMVVIILALLGLLVVTIRPSESGKKGTPVAQGSETPTLSHEQILMSTATAISQELTAAAAEHVTLTPATPQPIVILSSDTPAATQTALPTLTETATVTPSPTEPPAATSTLTETPSETPQVIMILPSEAPAVTKTETPTPTETSSVTPSPTETSTATRTPTITLRPRLTSTNTPSPTSTATPEPTSTLTHTPTPSVTASRTPTFTVTASITPSLTATVTITPSLTATPTRTPLPTSTVTQVPNATATWTSTPDAIQLAYTPVERNSDWTPINQEFEGVEMVLAPAGCFEMGSTDEQIDYVVSLGGSREYLTNEQPPHKVCFDVPFWIDRTEVTIGQFDAFGGVAAIDSSWTESERPRRNITWFEARDFCEQQRGVRLPTEAEWEFVARGPEAWIFPWGDEFVADNVVYASNSGEQEAVVGSRPGDTSWVGAVDLGGNLLEWVADWYGRNYYSLLRDDVVSPSGPTLGENRVLKGAAFLLPEASAHAATRLGTHPPDFGGLLFGFRCARSADIAQPTSSISQPTPIAAVPTPTTAPNETPIPKPTASESPGSTGTSTFTPSPTDTPTATVTPEPCFVRAESTTIDVRVGPGDNRGIRGSLPTDIDVLVIGQATDDLGEVWWQIQPPGYDPNEADRYWVAASNVTASGDCSLVEDTNAPPIVFASEPVSPTSAAQPAGKSPAITYATIYKASLAPDEKSNGIAQYTAPNGAVQSRARSSVAGYGWKIDLGGQTSGTVSFSVACYADRLFRHVVDWRFSVLDNQGLWSAEVLVNVECRGS